MTPINRLEHRLHALESPGSGNTPAPGDPPTDSGDWYVLQVISRRSVMFVDAGRKPERDHARTESEMQPGVCDIHAMPCTAV